MKKLVFISFLFATIACWNGAAISESYNFSDVGSIEIIPVIDHSYLPGSGEMVESSLTHNFLKYGLNIKELSDRLPTITLKEGGKILELSCIITEYTDSEIIIVPYHHENRGSTTTTVKQTISTERKEDQANTSSSTTTKTDGGGISSGNKVNYTSARVGIMIKLKDVDSGTIVWSNSFWYSSLELYRATETCVRNAVSQMRKLFN